MSNIDLPYEIPTRDEKGLDPGASSRGEEWRKEWTREKLRRREGGRVRRDRGRRWRVRSRRQTREDPPGRRSRSGLCIQVEERPGERPPKEGKDTEEVGDCSLPVRPTSRALASISRD
jgi:hypothetical protein